MNHRKHAQFDASAKELALLAKSFSHPARVAILLRLATADGCSCGGFVKEIPLAQATVSQHLAALVSSGLVIRTRQGTMSCYSISKVRMNRCSDVLQRFFSRIEEITRQKGCC